MHSLLDSLSTLLPQLNRLSKTSEQLKQIDPIFTEPDTLLKEATISLSEVDHLLQSHQEKVEIDPAAYQQLEERLSAIAGTQKKVWLPFPDRLATGKTHSRSCPLRKPLGRARATQ